MRRLTVMLLMLILLAGCHAQTGESGKTEEPLPPQEQAVQAEQEKTAEEPNGSAKSRVEVEMERAVYDPSLKTFTYFVHNRGEEAVEFGETYFFQQKTAVGWVPLPWKPNTGFHSIAYLLQPGATAALTCSTKQLLVQPEAGTYRLVKEVNDRTVFAEFKLGESIYTAETPYGFAPLEQLPATFSASDAENAEAVFTAEGVKNPEAVEEFLRKTGLGVDCQLRTVQDYGEGSPMVIDVIHENEHYLWRMWSDGTVTEKRFSYLITDGESIYLTNGADWTNQQRYGKMAVLPRLIPEGVTAEMVTAVEKQTVARLESNASRYRVWSEPDEAGLWRASLRNPEEDPQAAVSFSVQRHDFTGGGRGCTYYLGDWGRTETAITAMEWRFGGNLRLICVAADGSESILEFDPKTEQLISLAGQIPTTDHP